MNLLNRVKLVTTIILIVQMKNSSLTQLGEKGNPKKKFARQGKQSVDAYKKERWASPREKTYGCS